MNDNLYPIGTILKLKEKDGLVMVTGRLTESNTAIEYTGCPFPEGESMDNQIRFSIDDIEYVHFIGFQNEKELTYRQSIGNAIVQQMEEDK